MLLSTISDWIRKISFQSKGIILLTTVFGMFLYVLKHSLTVWVIFDSNINGVVVELYLTV